MYPRTKMSHINKATITPPQDFQAVTRPWNFPSFSVASRILPVEPCHSHRQPTALATPPQVSAACSGLKCMTLLGKTGHHSVGGKQPAQRLNETLTSLESVHLLIWCQSSSIPNIGEVRFPIFVLAVFTSGLRPSEQPEKSCAAALDCQGCSGHFIHCCESLSFCWNQTQKLWFSLAANFTLLQKNLESGHNSSWVEININIQLTVTAGSHGYNESGISLEHGARAPFETFGFKPKFHGGIITASTTS